MSIIPQYNLNTNLKRALKVHCNGLLSDLKDAYFSRNYNSPVSKYGYFIPKDEEVLHLLDDIVYLAITNQPTNRKNCKIMHLVLMINNNDYRAAINLLISHVQELIKSRKKCFAIINQYDNKDYYDDELECYDSEYQNAANIAKAQLEIDLRDGFVKKNKRNQLFWNFD